MSENNSPHPLSPCLKETSSLYSDIPAEWPNSGEEEDTVGRILKKNGLPMSPVLQNDTLSTSKSFVDGSFLDEVFDRKLPLGLNNKRQFRRPASKSVPNSTSRTSAAFLTAEEESSFEASINSSQVSNQRPKSFHPNTRGKSCSIDATLGDEDMSDSSLTQTSSQPSTASNERRHKPSFHPNKKTSSQQFECSLGDGDSSDMSLTCQTSSNASRKRPKSSFHPLKKTTSEQLVCTFGDSDISDSSLTQSSSRHSNRRTKSFHPKKNVNLQPDECSLGEEEMSDITSTQATLDSSTMQRKPSFHPSKKSTGTLNEHSLGEEESDTSTILSDRQEQGKKQTFRRKRKSTSPAQEPSLEFSSSESSQDISQKSGTPKRFKKMPHAGKAGENTVQRNISGTCNIRDVSSRKTSVDKVTVNQNEAPQKELNKALNESVPSANPELLPSDLPDFDDVNESLSTSINKNTSTTSSNMISGKSSRSPSSASRRSSLRRNDEASSQNPETEPEVDTSINKNVPTRSSNSKSGNSSRSPSSASRRSSLRRNDEAASQNPETEPEVDTSINKNVSTRSSNTKSGKSSRSPSSASSRSSRRRNDEASSQNSETEPEVSQNKSGAKISSRGSSRSRTINVSPATSRNSSTPDQLSPEEFIGSEEAMEESSSIESKEVTKKSLTPINRANSSLKESYSTRQRNAGTTESSEAEEGKLTPTNKPSTSHNESYSLRQRSVGNTEIGNGNVTLVNMSNTSLNESHSLSQTITRTTESEKTGKANVIPANKLNASHNESSSSKLRITNVSITMALKSPTIRMSPRELHSPRISESKSIPKTPENRRSKEVAPNAGNVHDEYPIRRMTRSTSATGLSSKKKEIGNDGASSSNVSAKSRIKSNKTSNESASLSTLDLSKIDSAEMDEPGNFVNSVNESVISCKSDMFFSNQQKEINASSRSSRSGDQSSLVENLDSSELAGDYSKTATEVSLNESGVSGFISQNDHGESDRTNSSDVSSRTLRNRTSSRMSGQHSLPEQSCGSELSKPEKGNVSVIKESNEALNKSPSLRPQRFDGSIAESRNPENSTEHSSRKSANLRRLSSKKSPAATSARDHPSEAYETSLDYTGYTPNCNAESDDECSIWEDNVVEVELNGSKSNLDNLPSINDSFMNGSLSSYTASKFGGETHASTSSVNKGRASSLTHSELFHNEKRASKSILNRSSGSEAEYSTLADFSMFASNDMKDASYQFSNFDTSRPESNRQSAVEEPMTLHITEDAIACSSNSLLAENSRNQSFQSRKSSILDGNISQNHEELRKSPRNSKNFSQTGKTVSPIINMHGSTRKSSAEDYNDNNSINDGVHSEKSSILDENISQNSEKPRRSQRNSKNFSQTGKRQTPINVLKSADETRPEDYNDNDGEDVSISDAESQESGSVNGFITDDDENIEEYADYVDDSDQGSNSVSRRHDHSNSALPSHATNDEQAYLNDGSDITDNSANFSSFNATPGPVYGASRISIGTNMNEFFAKPLHPVNKRLKRVSAHSTNSNNSLSLLSKCMQKPKRTRRRTQPPSHNRILRNRDNDFPQYVAPKLNRPAYWATNKLYEFLEEKLKPEHGIYAKKVSEKLAHFLHEKCKKLMKKTDDESEEEIITTIKETMVRLRITNSDFMFYRFCSQFLPDEYCNKIVPSMMPFTEKVNRPNEDLTDLFTKYF